MRTAVLLGNSTAYHAFAEAYEARQKRMGAC